MQEKAPVLLNTQMPWITQTKLPKEALFVMRQWQYLTNNNRKSVVESLPTEIKDPATFFNTIYYPKRFPEKKKVPEYSYFMENQERLLLQAAAP